MLSLVMPQCISGPENFITKDPGVNTKSIVCMMAGFVEPKTISGPESFVAKVAGDDDSFKVVCFNVIFYGFGLTFLPTNCAQFSKLKSIGNFVLASFHH